MRKNAVNREIRPIEGGVCAVAGFQASAVSCGIRAEGELDLALIAPEKRCPVGYVFFGNTAAGSLANVNKKRLKNGYAQAVFISGGRSTVFAENEEKFCEGVCLEINRSAKYSVDETLYFSVGEFGEKLEFSALRDGIKRIKQGLGNTQEHSIVATRSLSGGKGIAKQLSFSYDIGDTLCKIGVICKANANTTFVLMTTDAAISPKMLQRALESETRETLQLLAVANPLTPNDAVCILANGNAGNYKIEYEDSEYKKFAMALRATLKEVCKLIALNGKESGCLCCTISGVKSKQSARGLAKAVAKADCVRLALLRGEFDVEPLLYTLLAEESGLKVEDVRVTLTAGTERITVFDEGRMLAIDREMVIAYFSSRETGLEIRVGNGNYAATAFGRSIMP